nr:unnamed protein product [Callosobruchus chinensis]
MFEVPLATSGVPLSPITFWEIVMLYHSRPHLVNRKLAAVSQILLFKVNFHCKGIKHLSSLFTRPAILYELRRMKDLNSQHITEDFIRNIVECFDSNLHLVTASEAELNDKSSGVYISVRVLLPRMSSLKKSLEVVILDKDTNKAIFHAVGESTKLCLAPPFQYEIELCAGGIMRLNIQNFEDADSPSAVWLADKLFPKLLQWSNCDIDHNTITSLSLIQADEYCMNYTELKIKYAEKLIKEWPKKAVTDPQKYIFEDLAIASYLICLWKDMPKQDICFVDCGCGNGLLVFILNQEGYYGYGFDIRRRDVWDLYTDDTQLKVGSVTPESLYPEANWIIGNHSDELTPWIPLIALKSSPNTNFFLLPCCPYDFNGQKYRRTDTSLSQYSEYLLYIQDICERCGFDTKIDKLRIPSTKRTCLIGTRTAPSDSETLRKIEEYVNSRMTGKFSVRVSVDPVRNCTQLDKQLLQRLVRFIVQILLEQHNPTTKPNGGMWNKGGSVTIRDLSQKIDREDLLALKSQCGGLQTLLRNHRYLFEIVGGYVQLREPLKLNADTTKYRDKPCWFLKNHPDGCLYDAENCAYFHSSL